MCKGSTNMEDYYLVDISKFPEPKRLQCQNIINRFRGIPVDRCIGQEMQYLINNRVVTLGCCCGHGKEEPQCLIAGTSVCLAKELGYDPEWQSPGVWSMKLRGDNFA